MQCRNCGLMGEHKCTEVEAVAQGGGVDEWKRKAAILDLLMTHRSCLTDERGELGIARVKFDASGQLVDCLWAGHEEVLDLGDAALDLIEYTEGHPMTQLRAILASAPAGREGDGWQPIETAPKDGTRIIVAKIGSTEAVPQMGIEAKDNYVWWAVRGFWDAKHEHWTDGLEKLIPPSHWIPLPPAPAVKDSLTTAPGHAGSEAVVNQSLTTDAEVRG